MISQSRRASSKPLAPCRWPLAVPQCASPNPRPSCATTSPRPQGADMLATYANAMRLMLARPENDPRSWLWQWYTHFVNGTTTKANEITRIFGGVVTPREPARQRDVEYVPVALGPEHEPLPPLASHVRVLLRTDHSRSQRPRGLRDALLGLHVADPLKRGILPIQFRSPLDPVFNVLYRPDRLALANTGQRIDKNQPATRWTSAPRWRARRTATSARAPASAVRSTTVSTGASTCSSATAKNMGAVPYAARDPLFWVHHITIDRMWASWNANGGVNPASTHGATRSLHLRRPHGAARQRQAEGFLQYAPLGYQYDNLILPPPPPPPPPAAAER
jgi:tyrosinase